MTYGIVTRLDYGWPGSNARVVQERRGHVTIAMTSGVYGRVMPGMREEAAATIDAAFKALRRQIG